MTTQKIQIARLDQIQAVVRVASASPLGVSAVEFNGRKADAASILGMMSLDYKHPVELRSKDEEALSRICARLGQGRAAD